MRHATANPSPMTADYPRQQITALILAGGRGTRMGGRDKGLVDYRGQPLVRHLAATLAPQAAALLLSANRSHDDYHALGHVPLADRRAGYAGPLAGIETALSVCTTPYLLICPCDTPHVPADYGPRLWAALHDGDAELACATDGERDHYLHLLLPLAAAADLGDYLDGGGRAVRHWLAGKRVARARFDREELANLNTL